MDPAPLQSQRRRFPPKLVLGIFVVLLLVGGARFFLSHRQTESTPNSGRPRTVGELYPTEPGQDDWRKNYKNEQFGITASAPEEWGSFKVRTLGEPPYALIFNSPSDSYGITFLVVEPKNLNQTLEQWLAKEKKLLAEAEFMTFKTGGVKALDGRSVAYVVIDSAQGISYKYALKHGNKFFEFSGINQQEIEQLLLRVNDL